MPGWGRGSRTPQPADSAERLLGPGLYLLALLLLVALVGGFAYFWDDAETHAGVDHGYFVAKVRALAGPGAVDCGQTVSTWPHGGPVVLAGKPLDDALACVRQAELAGDGFLLLVQLQHRAEIEQPWSGIAGDDRGGRWLVTFFADVEGGDGERRRPRLNVRRCSTFRMPDDANDAAYGWCP